MSFVFLGALLVSNTSVAQQGQDYIEVLRSQLKTDKRLLVTKGMGFINKEGSKRFWPIYDKYEYENKKLGDKRVALVKEYAEYYENMTQEKAEDLVERSADLRQETDELRLEYTKKISDEISPIVGARFYQVVNQLGLVAELGLASNLPLIKEPKMEKGQG